MMSTNTLTSLAILKVNIDQGKDYFDYLYPFILQVLVEHKPDPVTIEVVSDYIRTQFGLEIPERTVEIVLKRISRRHPVKKNYGIYRITGNLPDPQLAPKQASAELHIRAVLYGLRQFSQTTINPITNDEDAVAAICAFLTRFDISCLRAYLRGTAIPSLKENHQTDIILVSDYIQHIQRTHPEQFKSFLILVQGHMLANALLCPDLHNAPKTYRNVIFYLDTPLLIQSLGRDGKAKQDAVCELIALVSNLGGKVAAFSHSRDELKYVLQRTADFLERSDGRGAMIIEARKQGFTKSDFLLLAESIDQKLSEAGIVLENTPRYIEEFQINEEMFEQVLKDEVSYYNPRAKEYDINSVRSIYVIRANASALTVEKAKAVLVTSNSGFAKAAWKYGQWNKSFQSVSSVITDFTLANMAWLKAPLGAPSLPTSQLLAISYAALEPSGELLAKYLKEIDRLEEEGKITELDHQLLRSSPLVYPELMHLTLGEDAALTTETITKTLKRVSDEIKKGESKKFEAEQSAHQITQDALSSQWDRNQKIIRRVYWRCDRRARVIACILSAFIGIMLLVGLLVGLGLRSITPILSWVITGGSLVLVLWTLANLFFGSTVKDLHSYVKNRCLTWFLKREAKSMEINLSELRGVNLD